MGTRLSFLQKSGQGRLGWQTLKSATIENVTPTKSAKAPSKTPPKLTEAGQEVPIDKYPSQTKTHQQWEAEMERLNTKYNLDCFSDSELDSESNEGEQYCYEHGYETLI